MKTIMVFLLFCIHFSCFGQDNVNVKALLDSMITVAKETSLYASTVNWDTLQQQIYSHAANAKTVTDLKPAFEALLNGLGDHHGKVISAKNYVPIAWFTDYENKRYVEDRKFDDEIWKIVNDTASSFEHAILKHKIGYLKIVGIAPNVDIEKESKRIRDALIALSNQHVDQWIIDLRYNGGGNMHPMMAGIGPLIGDGIVGSLTNLDHEKLLDWEIREGNFIYGGYQAVTLPEQPASMKPPKIAVLTSRWTVSSGEIVATALKGRPNTRFFWRSYGWVYDQ